MKLLSSFSLGALARVPAKLKISPLSSAKVRGMLKAGSLEPSIGHPALAELLSGRFGMSLPWRREILSFKSGDRAVVAQIFGAGRPPEGKTLSTSELKKLRIRFLCVEIV
jgi:hypothetical protein